MGSERGSDIVAVSALIERLLLIQKQLSEVNTAIGAHLSNDDGNAEFEQVLATIKLPAISAN